MISFDNATVQIAEAIGKKTWVLVSTTPFWMYMLDRSDSLWYPTMRLFRQTKLGDWSDVFDAVKEALMELGIKSD